MRQAGATGNMTSWNWISQANDIFLLLIHACTAVRSDRPVLVSASEELSVAGVRVTVDPAYGQGGFLVRALTDTSLAVRYFGTDYLVATLSVPAGTVRPVMYVGRGPGELSDANFAGGTADAAGRLLLDLFDMNAGVIKTIDVRQSEEAGAGAVVRERSLPANCWQVFSNGEELLCKVVLDEAGYSYQRLDASGERTETYAFWGREETERLYNYMSSADCLKPDGTKIALCFNSLDKLTILDLRDGSRRSYVTDPAWRRKGDLEEMRRLEATGEEAEHYLYSCCDDESVYALYMPGDEVRVFGWDGRFKRRLHLDRPVMCISVSPDGTLYGTDMEGAVYAFGEAGLLACTDIFLYEN